MHYQVVHQGAELHLMCEAHLLVDPNGCSLYQCMLLIAGECREVYEMHKDIREELEGNAAFYKKTGAGPCSSRTPVDVMLKLGAFTTLYACNVNLWGVKEDERSLILLGVVSHGLITHHIILAHGVYHTTKVLPVKSYSRSQISQSIVDCSGNLTPATAETSGTDDDSSSSQNSDKSSMDDDIILHQKKNWGGVRIKRVAFAPISTECCHFEVENLELQRARFILLEKADRTYFMKQHVTRDND